MRDTRMLTHPTVACTFCDKKVGEVERMIAGPRSVYICDECVEICNEIIAEDKEKHAKETVETAETAGE